MKKSEITQILGNLREKNDAIDKLVSEIAGYEDRLKLSVIREKFNAVLSLVEKYGKVPGEVKAVTETAPATTLTNASEAPEIALTASSDA